MSLRLSIKRQFLNQLYKTSLRSHNDLNTTIESHSITRHELSFGNLIQSRIKRYFSIINNRVMNQQNMHYV